ncbi:MAG: hypothetical protein AB1726_08295, partial [Planctomycetota bacterium]
MPSPADHPDSPRRTAAAHPGPRYAFRPRVWPLEGPLAALPLAEALSRLRDRRSPVLLDSAGGAPRRFALLAWDPLPPAPAPAIPALRWLLSRLEDRADG